MHFTYGINRVAKLPEAHVTSIAQQSPHYIGFVIVVDVPASRARSRVS